MQAQKTETIENEKTAIVTCVKCRQQLWTIKILSYSGNKVISTEWKSLNPELYKSGAPKTWDCPICSKQFGNPTKHGMQVRAIFGQKVIWL